MLAPQEEYFRQNNLSKDPHSLHSLHKYKDKLKDLQESNKKHKDKEKDKDLQDLHESNKKQYLKRPSHIAFATQEKGQTQGSTGKQQKTQGQGKGQGPPGST